MKKILMANDLSARSDRALQRAVLLAKQFGAELEVVTVIEEMFLESTTRENEAFATQALATQLKAVPEAEGVQISQRVMVGIDYEDIIHESETMNANLVVLGIHRHKTREMFRGTTAERVVRHGARPVLVVKEPVTGPYSRVLVATDLSSQAQAAIRTAARLAPQGEITLLHAVHRPFVAFLGRRDQNVLLKETRDRVSAGLREFIKQIRSELGDDAPNFEISLPDGEAHAAILAEVARIKPDLLAVGTHGRSGLAHAVIGSVAEQLLADCPIDILAVKQDV